MSRGQRSDGMVLGSSSCCSGEGLERKLMSLLPCIRGFRSSHGSAEESLRPFSSSRPFCYPGSYSASFPVYGDWRVEGIPADALVANLRAGCPCLKKQKASAWVLRRCLSQFHRPSTTDCYQSPVRTGKGKCGAREGACVSTLGCLERVSDQQPE